MELLEFYKFIKKEDNQYEQKYCENNHVMINAHSEVPSYSIKDEARKFFSDFKSHIEEQFEGDWSKSYQAIFIVKFELQQTTEHDDLTSYVPNFRFHPANFAENPFLIVENARVMSVKSCKFS